MINNQVLINKIENIEIGTSKVFEDYFNVIEEKIIEHTDENDIYLEENLFEKDDFHEIWMKKSYIHIPSLEIKMHEFVYYSKQKSFEKYEADYSGWMFFNDKTNEYIYDEGYTYLHSALINGFSNKIRNLNIGEIKCVFYN